MARNPIIRYIVVVARQHRELLEPTLRRHGGDPEVLVVLDRRLGERRTRAQSVGEERRHGDRRQLADFWADLRHHPVVLAPASTAATGPPAVAERAALAPPAAPPVAPPAGPPAGPPRGVSVPNRSERMEARQQLEDWVSESRRLLEDVLPQVLEERDGLAERLRDADEEILALRLEQARQRDDLERARQDLEDLRHHTADVGAALRRLIGDLTRVVDLLVPPGPPSDGAGG